MFFSLPALHALSTRYWWEYKQVWRALLMRDVLDRILFLTAFGFGLGAVMNQVEGVSYLAFLAAGIACSSPMMTMTLAGTFGAYERLHGTKIWGSWLATPVTLKEILLAELLYASLRSLPSIFILFALAASLNALPNPMAIFIVVPILFMANFAYGAVALCFTAHVSRTLYFSYVTTLWTTPMYLFSGVFFDLSQTPIIMQWFSKIYPLSYVINIVRPLLLGESVSWQLVATSLGALMLIFVIAFLYATFKFTKKLES